MAWNKTFPTMDAMHEGMGKRLLFASADELDSYSSMEVELADVSVLAESMVWTPELRRTWVAESRWNTMIRQYLDPVAVESWLDAIVAREGGSTRKRGSHILRTNLVEKRKGGNAHTRTLGSCMLSLAFRTRPTPQVTLYSRTSYIGYLSLLDMSVAYVAGKLAAERLGLKIEDFSFRWVLEGIQYHAFRTIAYPLGREKVKNKFLAHELDPQYPGIWIARKHHTKFTEMDKQGKLYSEMTYTSYRRLRKRWHSEMFGYDYAQQFADYDSPRSDHRAYKPLPDTTVQALDFTPIGLSHDLHRLD